MSQTTFLTKYPVHEALMVNHPSRPHRGWDVNSPIFRHRAVMHLFPQLSTDSPRAASRILFRLDTVAGSAPYFLIQSDIAPQEGHPVETKEIELVSPPAGSYISFRLSINAVKRKRKVKDSSRTRGTGIISIPFDGDTEADDQLPRMTDWLASKLAPALGEVTILNHQRQALGTDRSGLSAASPFAVQVDTIDGFARVDNPEALEELLLKGIGRAKSYGCGLLSIRPLRD
ncbi:MAG: type I-E CRISPR-associated protein Cas6/Cse3/CasE [Rothia sp. (in: high G+C Gram-positive bacteria)]|nr:type I-E CRISPR-associated protein Cas6/Cse3/CasE [Rothia sp. (in: high G+C Gram-positive bacteria)]